MSDETNVQAVAPDAAQAASAAVAVEAKPVAVGKAKAAKSGDLIADTAHEVENLTKTKALSLADHLAETVEVSYLKLGGVLKVIQDNTWFEPFPDFDTFVFERYGFKGRKGRYLIDIYVNLVTKQIPWSKVHHLGWTKLRELSPFLTLENLDDWVAKAEKLTVLELQTVLKAKPSADGAAPVTDEFVKFALKVKADQLSMINTAIAKAKGELQTEYDSVALENICASYVAGNVAASTTVDTSSIEAFCKSAPMMSILTVLAAQNPDYDISVDKADKKAA